ncbi:MAG: prepilin peptidase [Ignavibacteria bacterium]|nr:prepilin peptidase [Ignavibacteria bacterium]
MNDNKKNTENSITNCPHCNHKLSSWEQVLLSVDRFLMCRNCWYRITYEDEAEKKETKKTRKERKSGKK